MTENKRPEICTSWDEITKLHSADNLTEYISKLEPLRKIFDDTWIKQQSQKKGKAHLVSRIRHIKLGNGWTKSLGYGLI